MTEISVKCTSVSKGDVVRFEVNNEGKNASELKESGSPNYGQAEFVLPDHRFEEGKFYTMTIE